MNPVYTFGSKLSEITHHSESACVGLICLAIKDAGKTTQDMDYQAYKTVFQDYLPKRLEKAQVSGGEMVIAEMVKLLGQNQSLFTMSVR